MSRDSIASRILLSVLILIVGACLGFAFFVSIQDGQSPAERFYLRHKTSMDMGEVLKRLRLIDEKLERIERAVVTDPPVVRLPDFYSPSREGMDTYQKGAE